MKLHELCTAVTETEDPIEVARLACAVHEGLTVIYFAIDGSPIATIDSEPARTDVERHAYLAGGWRQDDMLCRLIAQPHVIEDGFNLLIPMLLPHGLVGAIRGPARTLTGVAVIVAARLAELGVHPWNDAGERLSPRQREIAELAVTGATTEEIASALFISPNTVKKGLKNVFERLDIDRRIQLAAALHEERARIELAPGISRLSSVTITRRALRWREAA